MKTDQLARQVVAKLKEQGRTLATAESCTGGGIGHALTAVPGSSSVYAGGVISYTNAVKEQVLGVPGEILEQFGAVSAQTAQAMATCARTLLHTDLAVSVTGLAGPDSDGSGKPVGLVYIGLAAHDCVEVSENVFSSNRGSVREQAVNKALELILKYAE